MCSLSKLDATVHSSLKRASISASRTRLGSITLRAQRRCVSTWMASYTLPIPPVEMFLTTS
jgi:hypothetical protein